MHKEEGFLPLCWKPKTNSRSARWRWILRATKRQPWGDEDVKWSGVTWTTICPSETPWRAATAFSCSLTNGSTLARRRRSHKWSECRTFAKKLALDTRCTAGWRTFRRQSAYAVVSKMRLCQRLKALKGLIKVLRKISRCLYLTHFKACI